VTRHRPAPFRTHLEHGLVYLFLIAFSVFTLFPVAWTVVTSVKPEANAIAFPPTWLPRPATLANYVEVIEKTQFPRFIGNTLRVALATVGIVATVSLIAAYGFSRFAFRGKTTLFLGLMACVMIAGATKVIPLYLLLLKVGLLNSLLGLVVTYSAELVPMGIWLLKAYLDSIPRELDDAALIDGCSHGGVLWRVIVPLALPGLIATSLLAFLRAAGEFIYATTFLSDPASKTAPVGIYMFITEVGVQWGRLSAAAMLFAVPLIVFFLILQRYFRSGLIVGSVR
jgi:multiple sugar transport system permease protein